MTFTNIPNGASVFLDANILVYHLTNDPKYGTACTHLLNRVELQEIRGLTSSHALADVAHRSMTIEAIKLFNWPAAGIAARLRKHHSGISRLSAWRDGIAVIRRMGVLVVSVTESLVETATQLSQQYELLTGDGLALAAMQANALTDIATADDDFDRVPWVRRYSPL